MFVDRVKVKLVAGKGGNGVVSWRREKFIPKGGPYGGNGGKGGSLIIESATDVFSLETYRHHRILKAESGKEGGSNKKQGRSGTDLIIKVPCGTIVKDSQSGEVLFDFTFEKTQWTACLGGKGGVGNAFFRTSTNRAPNLCTPGKLGEEKEIELELKLIADVGLVGMPNAGKSTLLSTVTHAHVKIAPYPFTTLVPNLSFIQCEDYTRILIADIPGIIKNAHLNKGLGLEFLKHIERTSLLVYVLDILPDDEERDAFEDFKMLRHEIGEYNPQILAKPFIVALNKIDKEGAEERIQSFKNQYPYEPSTLFEISALEKLGLQKMVESLRTTLRTSIPELSLQFV